MAPVEALSRLNGQELKKIVAKDGQEIALETPAGIARAHLKPRKSGFFEQAALGERFETQFPGETGSYSEFFSIFNFRSYAKSAKLQELTRKRTYQTNDGELVIELKAINSELPKK